MHYPLRIAWCLDPSEICEPIGATADCSAVHYTCAAVSGYGESVVNAAEGWISTEQSLCAALPSADEANLTRLTSAQIGIGATRKRFRTGNEGQTA